MFGLFKKKSERDQLMAKYRELLKRSHQLSHSNRKASDALVAEAEELWKRIEGLGVDS